jgi:heavy metal sensor kinase
LANFLRSIRLRLTLYFVGAMALVIVAIFSLIYFGLEPRLLASVDATLIDAAARSVESAGGRSGDDATRQIRLLTIAPARLMALNGEVLAEDANFPAGIALSPEMQAAALAGQRRIETLQVGQTWYRLLTTGILANGESAATIQVAHTLDNERGVLQDLRQLLTVAIPAALALAGLGGWLLAGSALAPSERVRRKVDGIIQSGDLSRRVSADLPEDEIGRLAHTFDRLLERTEQSMQRERQFTADASHELRSPLTGVKGEISVTLSRVRSAEDYRDALAQLELSVDEMSVVVEDLLTLTRASAREASARHETVDVGALVALVTERLGSIADAKHIRLIGPPTAGDGSPAVGLSLVNGDRVRLQRVITNLIDNALRYTPEGGTIEARVSVENAEVRVDVQDTGIGIAPEHINRVFDRFFRADAARDRESGGTGLGLAIAKAIVDGHGGTLSVTSQLGRGTRFTIRLPAAT